MGRIAKSNGRYRTKQVLCRDVAFVLNSELHYGTKCVVLDNAMWVWSEFDGKYDGCKFWSAEAARAGQEEKQIHDHAVPKKVLMEFLLRMSRPTPEEVERFFESYCFGAVITKAEDDALNKLGLRSKMPSDWDGIDPWARYKAAKIVLITECTHR